MERTKQRTKIKESTGERIFTGVIYAILILFCAIIVFPLLHIVSGSFSDPMALLRGEVSFWPKGFTFSMYEKVFKDASIWQGYGNTIVYTVLGTCISVVLTAFAAYPLSRKDFYGRNLFMGVFVFTMFFTGGMIPTFLIVQRLHLLNTMWALILPTAVSTYNLIIMRTFFESTIPFELVESASLDGCNDLVIFFRIRAAAFPAPFLRSWCCSTVWRSGTPGFRRCCTSATAACIPCRWCCVKYSSRATSAIWRVPRVMWRSSATA